ncbi:unnamed protein product [Pleuronectes platessa]|uniref:Uncharacterized protein n=1 Tax=Pleuronectes platessa TaxID=8262 RepID=A0A9N7TXB1_PLEPL|nr:unnamed protein product [Pleuronectes platessa]
MVLFAVGNQIPALHLPPPPSPCPAPPGWLPLTPRYLYVFVSRLTEGVPELLQLGNVSGNPTLVECRTEREKGGEEEREREDQGVVSGVDDGLIFFKQLLCPVSPAQTRGRDVSPACRPAWASGSMLPGGTWPSGSEVLVEGGERRWLHAAKALTHTAAAAGTIIMDVTGVAGL